MAAKRKSRRERGSGSIERQPGGGFIARTSDRTRSGRFATRPEAEAALDLWNKALGIGRDPNEGRQRLRDFGNTWLVDVCRPKVQPATLEFYTRHLGYATALIGDLPIERVVSRTIEQMLAQLGRDGLKPRSINHVRAVLRNCFNVAMRWKLVSENPAVDVPEWRVDDEEAVPLTPQQVDVLLAAIEDDRLCALYHVALTLGLRRGELLALRWRDIDFDEGVLHVRMTAKEGEGRKIETGVTKSRQGRTLPLLGGVESRLRARLAVSEGEARIAQQRAAERATAAGEPIPLLQWNPEGYIWCSEVGTLIQPANFNRRFAKLRRSLGLPDTITPHSMRKTALTDLAVHAEAKALQSIAGHADIKTTMDIYVRRQMGAMRAAVEAVEQSRRKA